jgi:hypothetical protein
VGVKLQHEQNHQEVLVKAHIAGATPKVLIQQTMSNRFPGDTYAVCLRPFFRNAALKHYSYLTIKG